MSVLPRGADRNAVAGSAVVEAPPDIRPGVEPTPPLLRGWFHLAAFLVSIPAGVLVVAGATSTRARAAAVVYAVALSALFAVSATYHLRVWTADGRRRMRRLDHGTIYVMIAGCYTPICLLALSGPTSTGLLAAAWVGAAIGLGLAITGLAEKPYFGLCCYIGLGWLLVIALPDLTRALSPGQLVLLVTGGLAYTLGSVVLGLNWPNPFPRFFGYHEVWHVLVIAACACHYVIIFSLVRGAR
ncbi:MAG: hemolysin III family protein [Actinomycetota bacterium]|nr:hemolysin III family protein [Actinomycetota bacterium]